MGVPFSQEAVANAVAGSGLDHKAVGVLLRKYQATSAADLDPRKYSTFLTELESRAAAAATSAPRPTPTIQFTRFSSLNHDLTKRVERDSSGALQTTSGAMAVDDFAVHESPFGDLPVVIAELGRREVLAWGVPKSGARGGEVATVARVKSGRVRANTIARSREYFQFSDGPALLMLDADLKDLPAAQRPNSIDEIRARLISVVPALASAPMCALPSAGAMIYDTATNKPLRGLTGVRLYVLVDKGTDIPAIGALLRDRLVLAGHGFGFVSRASSVHVRLLVDASVWQPERLDFIGGAICGEGLEQRRGEPRLWNENAPPLGLGAIAPLTEKERAALSEVEKAIMDEALPRAAEIRAAYVAAQRQKGRIVSVQWTPDAQVESLNGDHTIEMTDGTFTTVDEILADPAKYDDETCADPLEPEYGGGDRRIARIYTLGQDSGPVIHSFAHGGRSFVLRASAAADFADVATPSAACLQSRALPTKGERLAALLGKPDRVLLSEVDSLGDGEIGPRYALLTAASLTRDPLDSQLPSYLDKALALRAYAPEMDVFDALLRRRIGSSDGADARLLREAAWLYVAPKSALVANLAASPGILAQPSTVERRWVVDDLAASGWVAAFVGPASGGKTFMATALAARVAGESGARLGPHPVQHGSVLYTLSEDRAGVLDRVHRYPGCEHVHVAERVLPLTSLTDAISFTNAALAQIPDLEAHPLRLIVVDTLRGALGGLDENSAGDMSVALRIAKTIARMTGACVLLLHHTGHSTQERGRGSSAFTAELDVGWLVKKVDENISLTVDRLKTGAAREVLRFHIEAPGVVRDGAATPAPSATEEPDAHHVVRVMREICLNGHGTTRTAIRDALVESVPSRFGEEVKRTTRNDRVNRALRDAHTRGWIRQQNNKIVIANDPIDVVALPVGDLAELI